MEPRTWKLEELKELDTAALERLLREDAAGRLALSPEEIAQILTVLEQREPAYPTEELHEKWRQLMDAYEGRNAAEPAPVDQKRRTAEKRRTDGKRRRWRPVVAALSAAALIAIAMLPTGVYGTLAEWADGAFHRSETYDSLQAALFDYGVTEDVVPTWFPSGYVLTVLTVESDAPAEGDVAFSAAYERDGSVIRLNYVLHGETDCAEADSAVQLDGVGGGVYYLYGSDGSVGAIWHAGNLECSVQGVDCLDVLRRMLATVYSAWTV